MKWILNEAASIVDEMCEGIVLVNSNLELDGQYRVIKRKKIDLDKVCVISGGESGNDQAHAGYVGFGLLTAAVCGDTYESPSTLQIYNAILQTKGRAGTLLIVKNHPDTRMRFDAAAEMAQEDGINIASVYADDVIAAEAGLCGSWGKGAAGTAFVQKIAGAAAEAGMSLTEVKRVAERAIQNVRSVGILLNVADVSERSGTELAFGARDSEYGGGVRRRSGAEHAGLITPKGIVDRIIRMLSAELMPERGDDAVMMINGLGSMPNTELYVLARNACRFAQDKDIKLIRILVRNNMTSPDIIGASVTLLKLDTELKDLFLCAADAPAWTN